MGADARPGIGLLGAIQFLTRVPIRLRHAPDLGRCVPWFPIVGALIGAMVGAVAVGLMEIVPASVAAAVAVLTGVLLTGAFHEDGLADTADAMGGWNPEQRRAILKDSRHGSYGVAALCGSIVLRIVCVASLPPAAAFGGLIAAHSLGRGVAVGVMGAVSATPDAGLGADSTRVVSKRRAGVGVAAALVLATIATGWWAAPLALAAAAGAVVVTVAAVRALEAVNGDVLGAIEQVGECVVLVVVSGLAVNGQLWWV